MRRGRPAPRRRGGVGVKGFLAAAAGAAATLALAACGTPSPDLFIVDRDGTVPGAKLNLLVSDTSVRCNHRPAVPLTSAQTIEGRDILEELLRVQTGDVANPTQPASQIFRYTITDEKGKLSFPDTAQRPEILPRTALFTRRLAIDTCKLTR